MRNTPVTTERTRSDGIMSPSNQVIAGLILPHVESRRISRTIAIHDRFATGTVARLASSISPQAGGSRPRIFISPTFLDCPHKLLSKNEIHHGVINFSDSYNTFANYTKLKEGGEG
jgi:hypothetical protein